MTIVQYKFSSDKRSSVSKLKQMLDQSGAVWQKFGQMLSTQEELLGAELAAELQKMLYACPVHDIEYSKQTIVRMFGEDKYDLDRMELIGSGTIGQTYRVPRSVPRSDPIEDPNEIGSEVGSEVCIKVRHPNVVREVTEAASAYDRIKNSFFMPVALKMVCDLFFEGLVLQLDFHKEFVNGKLFREVNFPETPEIPEPGLTTDPPRPPNRVFVIPRMLETSDECLVIEYEPSKPICIEGRIDIDRKQLLRVCALMGCFTHTMCINGVLHADIHFGNYGIRDDQIVIYDFGFVSDVRERLDHQQISRACMRYDTNRLLPSFGLKDSDNVKLRKILGEIRVGDPNKYFKDIQTIATFVAINGIRLDQHRMAMLNVTKNQQSTGLLAAELEEDPELRYYLDHINEHGWASMIDTFFPYDDLMPLRDKCKEFESEDLDSEGVL